MGPILPQLLPLFPTQLSLHYLTSFLSPNYPIPTALLPLFCSRGLCANTMGQCSYQWFSLISFDLAAALILIDYPFFLKTPLPAWDSRLSTAQTSLHLIVAASFSSPYPLPPFFFFPSGSLCSLSGLQS